MYCYWRNIIKHRFNVNTISYNEKLFTMCRFQIGCFYIVSTQRVSSAGSRSPCSSMALQGPWGLSASVHLHWSSNYSSAGMPPKSSITQRPWQSYTRKMRRLGFSPINTNLTIQSIPILRNCFVRKTFFLNGTRTNSLLFTLELSRCLRIQI